MRTFYDGIGLPIDDIWQAERFVREAEQEPARLLPGHGPRGQTFACWRTSCPTRSGWAPRCTSSGTRSTRRTFPAACPTCLRVEAHTLSTEAVAMMNERQGPQRRLAAGDGRQRARSRSFRAAAAKLQRNRLLVFSRWTQVMSPLRAGNVRQPRSGPQQALVGPGGEVPGTEAARGPQRARLRHQVPHRQRPGLLSRRDGAVVASQVHHAIAARSIRCGPGDGRLRRQSGGRPVSCGRRFSRRLR